MYSNILLISRDEMGREGIWGKGEAEGGNYGVVWNGEGSRNRLVLVWGRLDGYWWSCGGS